ncbi:hypothetical protein ElyMa_003089200 [Elysia marginata]|uniref:Uncharacterized protein n=1 Tax=Elysia marginata TaxID=1093978 RepID=A0AAV4IMS1_9GAST|nr:hypothetical protein ElyMa_003089200 [Elysia marginata]
MDRATSVPVGLHDPARELGGDLDRKFSSQVRLGRKTSTRRKAPASTALSLHERSFVAKVLALALFPCVRNA